MKKKLQKMFAMFLAVSMVMSLLSVSAFAQENIGGADENIEVVEEPVGNFKCEFTYAHQHDDHDGADCELTKLVCEKHVHDDTCYTEGERTCGKDAAQDLICEKHTHEDSCYHNCDSGCYEKKSICTVVSCDSGEAECTCDACSHSCGDECYEDVKVCGRDNGEQICGFDYEHTHVLLVEDVEDEEAAENEGEPAEIDEAQEEDEAEEEDVTPCYEYHAHSVEKNCYVCSIKPHTHDRGCLTEAALADVVAVEALLRAAPTLE